jgi:Flp pilus assembly protein TadG
MQRLTSKLHHERGGIAVTVALLAIPILVCLAFVIDAGLLHWEKVQLQNGADAAALAVAQECAESGTSCTGGAVALASGIAGENANDGQAAATLPELTVSASSGHVTVIASTLNDEGTAVRHPLSSLVSPDAESTIQALAAAEWGAPVAGSVLPLAIADCELKKVETDPDLAKQIFLRSDNEAQDCPGSYPGGFGWLDDGDRDCLVPIAVDGTVPGTTGNNPGKTGCTAADFKALIGQTVLVPIYSGFAAEAGGKARESGGAHGVYHISKFAAFTVTGYKTSGSDDTYLGSSSPSFKGSGPNDCDKSGKCRGLRGYFIRYVELGEDFDLGEGGPDGGLTIVRMTE